ncbi:CHAT domain-containing protein [uncultured Aquimarina sp.]|uniref:CHAT domain-containing protein n=1 Tax=uncultured Aquimarina sp. TaxID=575652 RepID=UPI00262D683A|nr:CHAT domain-containing protein [uncultured Aquimarina sp.]
MNYRSFIFCCILFCLSTHIKAQYTEKFKEILSSEIEFELKKKKLDSFLNSNKKNVTKEELADCYHEYGKWYYKESRKHTNELFIKNAISKTNKAAVLKRALPDLDQKSLKKTLYNLGFFHYKNNDLFSAIEYYSELTEIPIIDSKTIAAHRALGNSYIEIGDFHKALDNIDHVIRLTKKDTNYREKLLQGYLTRADAYSLIGYKEKSDEIKTDIQNIEFILKKYNFTKQKLEGYQTRKYHIEGNRLLNTGKHKDAITIFSEILEFTNPKDSITIAKIHNSLGVSFLHLEQFENAKLSFEDAIRHDPKYTLPYENLGDLHIVRNKFTEGLFEYQKAINYAVSDYGTLKHDDLIDKENLELATQKYFLLHHLIQKGKAWINYYHYDGNQDHLKQAIRTFKLADKSVDIIRFESSEYKSKLYWREKASSLYMKAVEASFLLKNPEDAYYFMEKNKAILLLEDITNEQAKENAQLPQKLASREYHLKQNIHLSENKLNTLTSVSKDTLLKTKKEIYQHKRNYQVFVDSLSLQYPEYAINKQKIEVLPYLDFTTKYTSDKEMVLQYILNEDQGFGILHTKDQQLFFEIPNIKELITDISLHNSQIINWFTNQQELITYHKTAYRIFNQLIPEHVYSLIKGKNVTILPDYALQHLSFETLITSEQDHSYLIRDAEIRYAYSMSYLEQNNQRNRKPELGFLGVAPIEFDIKELSSLIHSKKEVTSISDILLGDTLLEEKSIKDSVISSFDQYRIIHLSTHADVGNVTNPWIAFRDQKLTLQEIYATKNQSDMVVLSACKTSLGTLNKGEGVMSLARGFFYAGTNSVVSSLWSVNDKANQELMIDFYKNIDQGLTKSTALRNAKLNYINAHDGSELSPFYWGSLILIGDNNVIILNQNSIKYYVISILFLLITIGVGLYYFQKKNRKVK